MFLYMETILNGYMSIKIGLTFHDFIPAKTTEYKHGHMLLIMLDNVTSLIIGCQNKNVSFHDIAFTH